MLKHIISNFCCLGVAVVEPFLFCQAKEKLDVDLTQVNKAGKALLSYFLAI